MYHLTETRPLGVSIIALGHILFGVLGPLWVLAAAQGKTSESAMSGLYVLGPILFNGVISIPLGVMLWKRFKPARIGVMLYGLLWAIWAIILFPLALLVIAYEVTSVIYLTRRAPKTYVTRDEPDKIVKAAIYTPIILIVVILIVYATVILLGVLFQV